MQRETTSSSSGGRWGEIANRNGVLFENRGADGGERRRIERRLGGEQLVEDDPKDQMSVRASTSSEARICSGDM